MRLISFVQLFVLGKYLSSFSVDVEILYNNEYVLCYNVVYSNIASCTPHTRECKVHIRPYYKCTSGCRLMSHTRLARGTVRTIRRSTLFRERYFRFRIIHPSRPLFLMKFRQCNDIFVVSCVYTCIHVTRNIFYRCSPYVTAYPMIQKGFTETTITFYFRAHF